MAQNLDQAKKPLEDTSVRFLKGVGPERSRLLQRLGAETLEDLMYLFPRRYEDRSAATPVARLGSDKKELASGVVRQKKLIYRRRGGGASIFRLVIEDESGRLAGVWFNSPFMEKNFAEGQRVALYGKAEKDGTGFQMIHPEYEILNPDGRRVHTGRIVPVYPLTQDLTQRNLRALQYELLLTHLKHLSEPMPGGVIAGLGLVSRAAAMKAIHFPKNADDLDAAYKRLVFDEFFMIQLWLALGRKAHEAAPVKAAKLPADAKKRFAALLPFELTEGQSKAIDEVCADLASGRAMHRLLQGDVGSGKTTVAAFALYAAALTGKQGAIMAPTEILAQQHYLTLSRLFAPAGIRIGLLCQGQDAAETERTLAEAANGECPILVGTHALIQSRVKFKALGLTVIDEQHKFGVMQRKFLQDKSKSPHLLVMTATPIPRTLAMTLYGDLDLTVMRGMPKGRGRIETMWVDEQNREAIYEFIGEEVAKGRQAFFVSPLVEKSDKVPLKDATQAKEALEKRFKAARVGLLHGQMKPEAKKETMRAFRANEINVLVATTIVEVGVDVPNASILVIENAERFGLSQLHQLRGRIGRGTDDATCILFSNATNAVSVERLRAFTTTESGFDLAEEDLKLRGPGDLFGERQHGIPQLRIGNLIKDVSILESARREAFKLASVDPALSSPAHAPLKKELHARYGKVRRAA